MELVTWEPFVNFGGFHSVFDDLFDGDKFDWSPAERRASNGSPAVDVLESKDSYVIRAELPGMKREEIIVEVKDGTLLLSGERKSENLAEGVEYRHVERVPAKFFRSFTLPETVRQDGIEATYKDGVLEIHVPKLEAAKPRQIDITVH